MSSQMKSDVKVVRHVLFQPVCVINDIDRMACSKQILIVIDDHELVGACPNTITATA
jgi:hypothetical protein